jgi:hypothetical protein
MFQRKVINEEESLRAHWQWASDRCISFYRKPDRYNFEAAAGCSCVDSLVFLKGWGRW